jgi:hypothetical protein
MSNEYISAEEQRQIQKDVNAALKHVFQKHENRDRSSVADVENPLRQPRKSDAEKAIGKIHCRGDSGRTIAKAAPCGTNAASAISALHADRSFAGREVSGNRALVEKLATAVGQAVLKEYGSVAEAKRELKKLLADDAPRPRNHEIVRRAKCKSGIATLTLRKGASYPFLVEVDGLYHSEYYDADAAERAFTILATGSWDADVSS